METLCDQSVFCITENDYSVDTEYNLSSEKLEIEKEDILSRVELKIKNHCNELRLQVDVKTKSLIEMLNKQRYELLNKINEFEFNKTNSAAKYFNEKEGEQLVERLNKKINNLIKESKRFEQNTIIQLGKIYEETNLIVENLFKANLMFFHESLSTELETKNVVGFLGEISHEMSVLGKLKYIGDDEISYGMKYIEIKDSLVSVSDNDLVAILSISDFYDKKLNSSKILSLSIYQNNEIKISTKIDSSSSNPIKDYLGICLNENVLVLFYSFLRSENYHLINYSLLDLYDVNELKLLRSVEIKKYINKIVINESKIFAITEENDEIPFIIVFDESLNQLEATKLPLTYCLKSSKIFFGCEKIFIQKDNVINIINENMGFFQEDFKIEDSFEIVSISSETSEIITYCSEKRIIRVYKLDGTIVGELDVSHFCQIDSIFINESGKMAINDKKKLKIYLN